MKAFLDNQLFRIFKIVLILVCLVFVILMNSIVLEEVVVSDRARWEDSNFGIFTLTYGRLDMFVRGLRDFILQETLPLVQPFR